MSSTAAPSIALLLARIALGVVFFAHGLKKLTDVGLAGLTLGFGKTGVPVPAVAAYFTTFVELIGGVALLLGAFTAVAGLLLFVDMLGGLLIVRVWNGVFVGDNGFELAAALGVGALLLAVFGAGKYSVDELIEHRIGWASGLSRY
jgi:putative oxidoreductase